MPKPEEITALELRKEPGRVLNELRQCRRALVTSRGWPVAFLLSLEESKRALLSFLEPFASMRAAAHAEVAVGGGAWLDDRIVLAGPGVPAFAGLDRHNVVRLRRLLGQAARRSDSAHVEGHEYSALFDRFGTGILVYAVVPHADVRRCLVGQTVFDRLEKRFEEALIHRRPQRWPSSRWWPGRWPG